MLTCREASRLSSEAQDRALTLPERLGLKLHLALCTLCRRYARQLDFLRLASQRITSRGGRGASLTDEARERIRRQLERNLDP